MSSGYEHYINKVFIIIITCFNYRSLTEKNQQAKMRRQAEGKKGSDVLHGEVCVLLHAG